MIKYSYGNLFKNIKSSFLCYIYCTQHHIHIEIFLIYLTQKNNKIKIKKKEKDLIINIITLKKERKKML